MASNPYTNVSISGYNSSPPSDDGSQTEANRLTWAKHKTKIGDPLKGAIESLDSAVDSAFATIAALLVDFVGDFGSGGITGLVPAPAAGDATNNRFLKADGTWTTPAGAGSVTSVATGTGLTGGTITGSGTISFASVANNTVLGNLTGVSAAPSAVLLPALLNSLDVFQGDLGSGGVKGLVPAPAAGEDGYYLKGSGSWTTGPTGTVTSIATSGGITGGTITTSGTLSLSSIATNTALANITGSDATPSAVAIASLTQYLNSFVGDSGSGGVAGIVPAPLAGDSAKYLKADGSWGAPAGSGTVTNIATGTGLSGGPITSTGTLTLASSALVTAYLDAFIGDAGSGGSKGLVPAPAAGDDAKYLKGDGTWAAVSGSGTVISVAATAPAAGFTVSGSPITTSGTLTFALADDLSALEGLASTGLAARTGSNTWAQRTITGTAAQITVTNGDGVSGNPTLSLPADVLIPTVLTVPNSGLHILDTNASHDLIVTPGSDLTADRILTITTGDAARTLTISASATVSQDYSTTGNPQFATIELGAATDTTVARVSAGVISIEGETVHTNSTSRTLTASTIELGAVSDTTLARVSAGLVSIEGSNILTAATGQPLDADLTSWAAITRAAGFDTFATTPSSANLAALVTNETGSGALVFADAPQMSTIELGHATDTTLSRSSAGILAVEGVTVSLNSTSATHTAGTIELGAASDTTLARVSAGVISVEGVTILTTATGQPLDSTLTALAAYSTNGLLTQTAADTFTGRTITAGTGVSVTNGNGVSGNPTIDLASIANNTVLGNVSGASAAPTAVTVPQLTNILDVFFGDAGSGGTKGLVPAPTAGDDGKFLKGDGTWGTAGSGTVTSVNLTAPAAGITVSGGPVTTSGSITLALADDLAALEALASTGLAARTSSNTWAQRTVTGTANQITVTNGDGVSGNPTLSLPSDVIIPTVLTAPNSGLHILDTDASHDLIITPGSNLTADRVLTITTGDAARTLTISASATVSQDYSTAGSPEFTAVNVGHATDSTITRVSAGLLAIEGSNILTAATGQPLDATLTALAAYSTNGLLTQTAADTFTGRTVTAGNSITVTNGNGVSGNPTIALTDMAEARFKGRISTGTGAPEDLTPAQATSLLEAFFGDAGSGGTKGLVPAPAPGDSAKFLRADGTWQSPAGAGTVTNVATGTGLTGGPITSSGTISLASSAIVTNYLDVFFGDEGSGGTKGLVPAPAAGDDSKFLKGDGSWGTPTGSGVNSGQTTIDFGAYPGAGYVTLAVTGQTGISSSSEVKAWITATATSDHSIDEHVLDPPDVIAGNIVAGTGFTIYGVSRRPSQPFKVSNNARKGPRSDEADSNTTKHYGQYTVHWMWA